MYSWTSVIRPSVIGYLYYPATILQYILSIFNLSLAQDKNKEVKYLFYFIVYPFYINDKLLQIE